MQFKSILTWTALLMAAPGAFAGTGSSSYVLSKIQLYFQKSSSGAVATPSGYPYVFSAGAPAAATLTLPGGAMQTLSASGGGSYKFNQAFTTESGLDTAYPAGTYSLSGPSFSAISFTFAAPSPYPSSIPALASDPANGSWQNNVLVVDPTLSTTLDFSTFAEYATQGVAGHMSLSVTSETNADQVNLSQQYATETAGGATVSATPFTSYVIPANTFTAGAVYEVELTFDTIGALDTTTLPGAVIATTYTNRLDFFIGASSSTPVPAPAVTTQPADQTADVGSSATFTLGVSYGGSAQAPANVAWIWHCNGLEVEFDGIKHILGSGGSLIINNVTAADAGTYYASVVTAGGATSSRMVTLTTTEGTPSFTVQPTSAAVAAGSTAVFNAAASGSPRYQWYHNEGAIAGATGTTLVVRDASSAAAGSYTCVATNAAGSATSTAATLSVASTNNPGRLINISTRAQSGTGANVLIVGFVVGGAGTSGAESLLVRASGPALIPFGVTNTLPDAGLELFNGQSAEIGSNNGWAGSSEIATAANAVGAFAWPDPNSLDSALFSAFVPGSYSVEVSDPDGHTGVALAELYDATPAGDYTSTTPRLINVSARVQSGSGANVLIAGFVIGGSTAKTVLIRASGPALIPFGVTGTLSDAGLQLFDGHGHQIGSNNGWAGNAQIASVASSVGAFTWSNAGSLDSALVVTLPPGAYSAQVADPNGGTGVALVEVYDVP